VGSFAENGPTTRSNLITGQKSYVYRELLAFAAQYVRIVGNITRPLRRSNGFVAQSRRCRFLSWWSTHQAGTVANIFGHQRNAQDQWAENVYHARLVQRCLVYDSLGNLYKETSPGNLSGVSGAGMAPDIFLASTTHFGREYMAFGDGTSGQDIPRQYDDANLDRVSQVGQGGGPAGRGFDVDGQHLPGCAPVRGGFCDAPGILDRALAACQLDCRRRFQGERHKHSNRASERCAAPSGIYGRGRC
jgi:hypothetical protein